MILAVVPATCVRILPAYPHAYADRADQTEWVLDDAMTIDPSVQSLEKVKEKYAFEFEGWLGTRPGVINSANVAVSDSALKLKVANDDQFDFSVSV